MTDDSAPHQPGSRSWRIPLLVGLLVLVIVVAVAVLVGGDDDDDDTPAASDRSSSAAPTASAGATESSPASQSPTETPSSGDPTSSPIIDKAVRAAIEAGFPALVPSGVPDGWTVTDAAYRPQGGGSWRIDLTAPGGTEVVLVQSTKSVDALVEQHLGADARATGRVDLSGTGTWKTFQSATHAGIAKQLVNTGALVLGPDQDTVVSLAEQLLTAEDADLPEAG